MAIVSEDREVRRMRRWMGRGILGWCKGGERIGRGKRSKVVPGPRGAEWISELGWGGFANCVSCRECYLANFLLG